MHFNHSKTDVALLKNNFLSELDKNISYFNFNSSDVEILFECYLQSLIKTEFDIFISKSNSKTYRNGYSNKLIKTTLGEINIKIPRDRNNEFGSQVIKTNSICTDELAKVIIKLYQLGLSNKDVTIFLDEIYGVKYSRQSISNFAKVTNEIVSNFNDKPIDSYYVALFIDATYIPIKFDNSYQKHGLHLVVGINKFGHQEILGYSIGFQEQNILWAELLDDLKSRGLKQVDIFVSDGFVGLDTVIKTRFPDSLIQRCTVHLIRNIMSKAVNRDIPAIKADFSTLFKFSDEQSFLSERDRLIEKYNKYGHIKPILTQDNIITYMNFPQLMHRTIKTNNRIESVNQKIKTRIKFKKNFPDKESFERVLVASILAQNNTSDKPVGGLIDYLKQNKKDL